MSLAVALACACVALPTAVAAFGGAATGAPSLEACVSKLVAFDFSDAACLKFVIKKALGYGIIAGACIVKLPQILTMVRARSSTGIPESSVAMETLANLSTAVYHLLRGTELSDFGECLVVCAQNVTILALVWHYTRAGAPHVGGVLAGFGAAVYAMAVLVPPELRWALTWVGTTASMMRWVPQATTSFRNGHTGCLSVITVALTVLGLAARTWTYHQNGDTSMVRACATSCALAVVCLLQIVAYWGATRAHMAALAKQKRA